MKRGRRVTTRVVRVPPDAGETHPLIREAAELLRAGRLVAFPTETVYGLGASGLDGGAVRKIFAAKGRPLDNPVILHVAGKAGIKQVAAGVPDCAHRLIKRFWPGPLTLVVERADSVPAEVTAGLRTVAVRCPDHPVALALIRAAGVPIAAPSANLSGRPSPTRAEHVLDDLEGLVELILDSGPADIGLESTVIDVTGPQIILLRPGGLPVEQIEAVVGRVVFKPGCSGTAPRSPGTRYTHYSPAARVVLIDLKSPEERLARIREEAARIAKNGQTVGILCASETARDLDWAIHIQRLGSRGCLAEVAARLFWALRELDDKGCDIILAEGFPRTGYGLAIMDRLIRAADEIIS